MDCSVAQSPLPSGGALRKVLKELPGSFQVGLRVFGHVGFWAGKKGQPPDNDPRWKTDTELMISIGPLGQKDRGKLIKQWIDFVEPRGATPLVYSLLRARKDFPAFGRARS